MKKILFFFLLLTTCSFMMGQNITGELYASAEELTNVLDENSIATDRVEENKSEYEVFSSPVPCPSCTSVNVTVPTNICALSTVTFLTSTAGCNFSDPSIWRWDYGDGAGSTASNAHTFSTPGQYTIKFYIPGNGNCAEFVGFTTTITVLPASACAPPCPTCTGAVSIIPPISICAGVQADFDFSANGCNFNANLWSWNFGDGTPETSNDKHTYAAAGTYTVQLLVPTYMDYCNDYIAATLVVNVTGCPAVSGCSNCAEYDFYFPDIICVGEKIAFEKALANCYSNGQPIVALPVWDFGDGSALTTNPEHKYINAGTYTVSMSLPGFCFKSKIINVIPCLETSCDPASVPCASLNLTATVSLDASNLSTGIYTYRVTPTPAGTYTYLWSVSPNASIQGANSNNTVTILKPANAGPVTLTVTVNTTNGSNCYITKTFDPCANFSASLSQLSYVFPDAKYKVAVVPNVPPASSYTYTWQVSSLPAAATNANLPNDPKDELKVSLTASAQENPLLFVSCLVKETNNGSNGCAVNVAKDFEPCSGFLPEMEQVSQNGTSYTYKVKTPILGGGGGSFTYLWSINGSGASITSPNTSNTVTVSAPNCANLSVTITNTNGSNCKKTITNEIGCQ